MSRVFDKLAVRATRLTRLAYFGALVAVVAVFAPNGEKVSAGGTFFGSPNNPRIVRVFSQPVEIVPSGVVFMMNVTDPKEALELLGRFPFGQAGLMEFQIIPLGPIGPLRVLLTEPAK